MVVQLIEAGADLTIHDGRDMQPWECLSDQDGVDELLGLLSPEP